MASAEAEVMAINDSLLVFLWFANLVIMMLAAIAQGRAVYKGEKLSEIAIALAPNATWESPSPSMDWRRGIIAVPSNAAEIAMAIPVIIAR